MGTGIPPLSVLWLGTGVALTTATRLRFGGLPLGPGEILLLTWLLATIDSMLGRNRLVLTETGRVFVLFWSAGFALMLTGWVYALAHQLQVPGALHDFAAYSLVALFTLVLTLKDRAAEHLRALGPVVLSVVVGANFVQLLLVGTGFVINTYGRFVGLSVNPNQVALAMASAPFYILFLLRGSTRPSRRWWYRFLLLASLAIGIAALSDGMFVGWLAGLGTVVVFGWAREFIRGRAPFVRAAVLYVLAPTALIGLLLIVGPLLFERVVEVAEELYYGENNQGSVRLTLVLSGLRVIARSPLFGWGPGAHSTLRSEVIHESEAHNGLIDWGTATGLPGMLLFLALHGWVAWKLRRQLLLLGGFLSIFVLGFTHHDLRHPIYWFYILFALAAAARTGGERAERPRFGSGASPGHQVSR
jgi:O-antigen ligase